MASNLTPVGNELQINLAPNQDDDQFEPDVAILTDGRYFVVFTDQFASGNYNIIGQFISAGGTLSGGNIDIEVDPGFQYDPAVAQRAGGAAIVVWRDEDSSDEIHYDIVSSAGTLAGEQVLLAGDPLSEPDVATLADGRSLVVAQQFTGSENIVFRLIDAAGAPSGLPGIVDNGAGDQSNAAVAAFGNNALVVYEDRFDGFDIQARFFNGTSFAPEVVIADIMGQDLFLPDVAALIDGRFIVVWENDENDLIEGRFVSAAGAPLGEVFTITEGPGGLGKEARVAALPDGEFLVTWEDFSRTIPPEIDVNQSAIHARRFDANGSPAGDEILVNIGDSNSAQDRPAIATNIATGQTFIVWEDSFAFAGADNDPDGIRGHAFVPSLDTVDGTSGDDVITTYNIGEPINGLEGDDLINALGGNDIVHGGAGFDHIKGGLGNDQLFGEGGEDLLKGEDGDDLLVGGVGRDVQIGGSGADSFDFNKLAESRIGAKHDVILGFKHSEHDRIDLKTIDADTTTGGNQAFDFIGGAGFTGAAGELRLSGGLLLGDTNGNGIADFEIKVAGIGAGANSDFVL